MNKITLGTAQWGMNYGITNSDGIPNNEELKKIINLAKKSQITFLDTASGYGNAEQRIGNLTNDEFNIITKVGNIRSENSIKQQLIKSLKNLKTESVYGCLFHNVDELLKNPSLWEEIQVQKKAGLLKKAGYSLYHPQELEKLLQLNYIPALTDFWGPPLGVYGFWIGTVIAASIAAICLMVRWNLVSKTEIRLASQLQASSPK